MLMGKIWSNLFLVDKETSVADDIKAHENGQFDAWSQPQPASGDRISLGQKQHQQQEADLWCRFCHSTYRNTIRGLKWFVLHVYRHWCFFQEMINSIQTPIILPYSTEMKDLKNTDFVTEILHPGIAYSIDRVTYVTSTLRHYSQFLKTHRHDK